MPFKKGDKTINLNGRPKGSENKITRTIKMYIHDAFEELQLDPDLNLVAWAKKNPALFYQLAAKLIPAEINAKVENKTITVIAPGKRKELEG